MIMIQRLPAPLELTHAVVAEKTARFKSDPKQHVWKEPYIESRLVEMSHNKCCYCECTLGVESKYMEVEHFHDKHQYPDEVVVWENLLPSCKTCNGKKGTHDTYASPIVDPSINNPKDYLAFNEYFYKGKNPVGLETINALHLNDIERRCVPRFKVCAELLRKVEQLLDRIQNISPTSSTSAKNKMRNDVVELLEACQCDREYTAIKATKLGNDTDYIELINKMKLIGLWTPELSNLDSEMRRYMLDIA